jgi:ABC-type transporter Mla subunit MlaD
MSNLQKFNVTLEEFDSEVGKLKEVSQAYQKLERLIVSYENVSNQFEQNRQDLMTITALQKDQREEIFTLIRTVEKQFLSGAC